MFKQVFPQEFNFKNVRFFERGILKDSRAYVLILYCIFHYEICKYANKNVLE